MEQNERATQQALKKKEELNREWELFEKKQKTKSDISRVQDKVRYLLTFFVKP